MLGSCADEKRKIYRFIIEILDSPYDTGLPHGRESAKRCDNAHPARGQALM